MIFTGDLHGGYPSLLHHIKQQALTHENIIQVGDWGLGFQSLTDDIKSLQRMDQFLRDRHIRLYIIRGNHDNKWYWDNSHKFGLRNVHLVKDYTTLTIEAQRLLFIGGGISIDRTSRSLYKDYWPDEIFELNEQLLTNISRETIDIVVTHIAPRTCWPYMLTPLVEHYIHQEKLSGGDLQTALLSERAQMEIVFSYVRSAGIREWYYGHYHQSMNEQIDGIVFRCLDTGEIYYRP